MKTICLYCGSDMTIDTQFDFRDWSMDGEGVVTQLRCLNKNCNATADFFISDKDDN